MTWQRIVPPTEEEIERFCEEHDVTRPDPDDMPAVCSFAARLAEWLPSQRPIWQPQP